MSIFLCGGKRLVPQQLLNGAQVGAIGEQVRGEGVPQRMRVQIPVHVYQAHVFFDDAADGALRKAPAGVIQKDRFALRSGGAAGVAAGSLQQKLFAQWPVFIKSFLGLIAVRYDAFLVAFPGYA